MTGGDLGVGSLEVSAALRQFSHCPVGVVDVGDEHEIDLPAGLFVAFFHGLGITGCVVDAVAPGAGTDQALREPDSLRGVARWNSAERSSQNGLIIPLPVIPLPKIALPEHSVSR